MFTDGWADRELEMEKVSDRSCSKLWDTGLTCFCSTEERRRRV